MASQPVTIAQKTGPGFLVRALYFVFFGLWFSGIWAAVAWFLCITIIGLPFGLWMLNRLPQVATLRAQRSDLVITSDGRARTLELKQPPFLLRAAYFVLIGWWLSAIWISIAWALCASVIGLLPGFWMLNRVPGLVTLART
jgi:uncharacterized membrane protein YccF (DUF307 family)